MISYRQADLLQRFKEQNAPVLDCDLIIHFPQTVDGFAKVADGSRYVADMWLNTTAGKREINENIIAKVEKALRHSIERQVSEVGQTWSDFSKVIRDQVVAKLQPICAEPITVATQTTGRYEWIVHLKIKDLA